MSYLVLARKYRPQTFDAVVGQEQVTRTLANAIASDRVAHAILFSGPRGTGKTTVARILAKAMNCTHGPDPVPCDQCRSCKEIRSGSAVDVYEIDGASNNSVDQIRELRENIKYMPAHSRFKIYIIDEVHMLSIAAFNALLKTLEEPPAHILFMFATTEAHKIPVTILSRCQRHEFRRIDVGLIEKQMETICDQEGIPLPADSRWLIAREAGGSMRDALSLMDLVSTCANGSFPQEDVVDLLGLIDRKTVFDISDAILKGDIVRVLDLLDTVYDRGFDLKKLHADLVEHFRNLLVIKIGGTTGHLVDLPGHEIDSMNQQIGETSSTFLHQLLGLILNEEAPLRMSSQPKLILEMAFLKMCQMKPVLSVDVLIDKLEALRASLSKAGNDSGNDDPVDRGGAGAGTPPPAKPTPGDKAASIRQTSSSDETTPEGIPPLGHDSISPVLQATPQNPEGVWKRVLDITAEKAPMLAPSLMKCTPPLWVGDRLEIEVNGNDFNLSLLQRPKNVSFLENIFKDLLGRTARLTFKAPKDMDSENSTPRRKAHESRIKQEALSHPLVADAVEIFNARVIDVKIL